MYSPWTDKIIREIKDLTWMSEVCRDTFEITGDNTALRAHVKLEKKIDKRYWMLWHFSIMVNQDIYA